MRLLAHLLILSHVNLYYILNQTALGNQSLQQSFPSRDKFSGSMDGKASLLVIKICNCMDPNHKNPTKRLSTPNTSTQHPWKLSRCFAEMWTAVHGIALKGSCPLHKCKNLRTEKCLSGYQSSHWRRHCPNKALITMVSQALIYEICNKSASSGIFYGWRRWIWRILSIDEKPENPIERRKLWTATTTSPPLPQSW